MSDAALPAIIAPNQLLRLWLIVETAAALVIGVLWLAAVPLSLMAFGAPGTTVDARAWAFVLALWSYPVWALAPLLVAWSLLRRGRSRPALLLSLVPPLAGFAAGVLFWH